MEKKKEKAKAKAKGKTAAAVAREKETGSSPKAKEKDVVVVAEDASVHLYDVFKREFVAQFSMGELARTAGVAEAKFCPGGRARARRPPCSPRRRQ